MEARPVGEDGQHVLMLDLTEAPGDDGPPLDVLDDPQSAGELCQRLGRLPLFGCCSHAG
jgi:hypothetical protein